MPRGKENKAPSGKGARGGYRSWSQDDMKKALADCNAGMRVRESARINNVPRG